MIKYHSKDVYPKNNHIQIAGGIMKAVDAIRNIGNFAAHPLKDMTTGIIANVEPGEAEWSLDVLEALFDFVYHRTGGCPLDERDIPPGFEDEPESDEEPEQAVGQ